MKKTISYGLIGTAMIVCIVGIYVWRSRPETAGEVGARALSAFELRDGETLWNQIPPEERKLYPGLTKSRLQALLDLSGLGRSIVPTGQMTVQEDPRDGSAFVSQDCIFNKQFHEPFVLRAETREKHVAQVCRPVTALINLAIFNSGIQTDPKFVPQAPTAPIYIAGLKKIREKLVSIGFDGATDLDLTTVVPWDTLLFQWNAKLKP